MYQINGFDNEYRFVQEFNGKIVNELNPLLHNIIDDLFLGLKGTEIIYCWRNHYKQKSDIFIKINGVMKGISIKMGSRNSMHTERIYGFINFLKENGISEEIIKEYQRFHYADGTLDGTGIKRMSAEEYKTKWQDSVNRINEVLKKESVILNAINRFVLKGNNSFYEIDGIICGESDDFLWINKKDIYDIILSKKDNYCSTVHFGPLVCQPKNRCLNYNDKYEKDRHCIQIKWYSLYDDIIENMNNKELNKGN